MTKRWIAALLLLVFVIPNGAFTAQAKSPQRIPVWVPTNTEKVARDQAFPAGLADQVLWMESAKNEYESGQVIIKAGNTAIKNVQVSVSDLKQTNGTGIILQSQIQKFRQHYIQTTIAWGNLPLGWYPDALIPIAGTFDVQPGQNQGIWLTVQVPKGQNAGTYTGTVTLSSGITRSVIPLVLRVWDFELSDVSHSRTAFAIWGNQMAEAHGLAQSDPDYDTKYWALVKKYYEMLLDYRITPTDFPIQTENISQFITEAQPYVADPRVSGFRIPHYIQPIPGQDPNTPPNKIKYELNVNKTKQMYDAVKAQDWFDKGYFYLGDLIDEPHPGKYPLVVQYANDLKDMGESEDPRHIVTKAPVEALEGYVDTWAPILNEFDEQYVLDRQNKGDHVWWYSCCVHPQYPTYHIDDDLISPRIFSWMQRKLKIEGNLYWSTTVFKKYNKTDEVYEYRDVWTDPVTFPIEGGGNGEGFLFYPGKDVGIDGPIPTIRLDAIREGMEDYEYLWMLEDRMRQAAVELGVENFDPANQLQIYYERLFSSINEFTRDPDTLLQVRREIGDLIEAYGRNPVSLITAEASDQTSREISIFTKPNAEVKVNGTVVTPSETSTVHDKFSAIIPVVKGSNEFIIDITSEGNSKSIVINLEVVRFEAELNFAETTDDVSRFLTQDVQLSLAEEPRTQGNNAMKAEYGTASAFPSISLKNAGNGFRSADWSKFNAVEFAVYNPGSNNKIVNFNVKFTSQSAADDNHQYQLRPDMWRTVRIPLAQLEQYGIDLKNMIGFEIWMFQQSSPVTLIFDHFRLVSDEPQDNMSLYEAALNKVDTSPEIARWSTQGVTVGLDVDHKTQGTGSMQAVFAADVDFPNLKLFHESSGFRTADWSGLDSLLFDVVNPSSVSRKIYVKFHDTDGEMDDNHAIVLAPNAKTQVRIPVSHIGVDITKMKGLEIWMWRQSEPVTLYFDHFRFESDTPVVSMEP